MASVADLMLFHKTERELYKRLRSMKDIKAQMAAEVIALWLWMESIGHHDLVRRIVDLGREDEDYLRFVFTEGEACVNALRISSLQQSGTQKQTIPITATLINQPIDIGFFSNNREVAVQGITHFLHCICNVIFNDKDGGNGVGSGKAAAAAGGNRDDQEVVALPACSLKSAFDYDHKYYSKLMMTRNNKMGQGIFMGSYSSLSSSSSSSSSSKSSLNPMAQPWSPRPPSVEPSNNNSGGNDQNHRSMFLTFSKGYPLSKNEIINFFKSRWGSDCVESLMIGRTAAGVDPMFARIVFKDSSLVISILNGNSTAQFVINGKHLRARLFVPRP